MYSTSENNCGEIKEVCEFGVCMSETIEQEELIWECKIRLDILCPMTLCRSMNVLANSTSTKVVYVFRFRLNFVDRGDLDQERVG